MFWRVKNNFDVSAFYLRATRNVVSGEIARLPEEMLKDFRNDRDRQRMALPAAWSDFITFLPHLECGRSWKSTVPFSVDQEGNGFLYGEIA